MEDTKLVMMGLSQFNGKGIFIYWCKISEEKN